MGVVLQRIEDRKRIVFYQGEHTMQLEKVQYTIKTYTAGAFGLLTRLLVVILAATVFLTVPAAVPAQQPAQIGTQARSAAKTLAGEGDSIRPFRVNIP